MSLRTGGRSHEEKQIEYHRVRDRWGFVELGQLGFGDSTRALIPGKQVAVSAAGD